MRFSPYALPCVLVAAATLLSCARFKPMYDSDELEPGSTSLLPDEDPVYSVYLTGSAGKAETLAEAPALQLLQRVLAKADTNSAVLFMGDNVSPVGFPPKDKDKERERAKRQVKTQLAVVEDFAGTVRFLHGDKDWKRYKLDGAERQEDYIEKKYGEEIMVPENACGDPVLVEVADNVVLLLLNSQWFVGDWDEYQEINEGCAVQTRADFRWRMTNLVKDVAFDHVIVAMHHPVISRGPRGGENTLRGQFRRGYFGPFSNWWRSKIGVKQDLYSPKMDELRRMLRNLFADHTAVTFARGHEYLLQFGEYKDIPVIGSGTASRVDPGKVGQGTIFTAGVPGFSEVHYYANGEAWVRFRQADGSPSGKTLFERKLYTMREPEFEGDFELYESGADSFAFAPFADYREFGPLYKWAFGTNNRELFETPYTYPVLRLEDFDGGVTISKRGGGGQTNSLRLTTEDGRDYALRSIRKDPSRLLPAAARVGPVITLTRDLFFTANPFGALTAADIAEGVDIPHANPKIVYLPAQPGLGDLNVYFADDLYLLEERPNDEWIGHPSPLRDDDVPPFGTPDDIDGRDDVQERIREDYRHSIDQEQLVRARLLDVLLGDFDRHGDQWRYAEYKNEETGERKWRVIPRDRDQAMLKIDGVVPRIAGMTLPAVREVQNFDERQPWIEDFSFQARMLDRRFLNELTREQWLDAARDLQERLTDEEIERAFDDWPAEAREGRKEQYVAALKQRRDDLVEYARKIYKFQAKEVYVVGTDEDDFFEVTRNPDGTLLVEIFDYKGQEKGDRYYSRLFDPKETNSVQLFGLREEDRYEVKGVAEKKSIKVRIVPGPEKDEVVTTDAAKGIRRKTRVYAWPDEDKLELGKETETHLTRYQRFNQYDYRGVDYDYGLWLPNAGFNVDDGVRLGLLYTENYYTFHRRFQQSIGGLYATASQGLRLDYNFSIIDLAPRLDVGISLAYQTPSFATNFFGLGNDTEENRDDRSFYRIRQEIYGAYPTMTIRNKNHEGGLSLRLVGEGIQLERDSERNLGEAGFDIPETDPLFDRSYYLGAGLGYIYANVDNPRYPRDGMRFETSVTLRHRVDPLPDNILQADAALTVYQHLWKGAAFVTRVGVGLTEGDYFFYDGQALGAGRLRGYRRERFIGDQQIYQNIDLRQQLNYRVLKSRIGLFASFDHGRVYLEAEEGAPDADVWRSSVGGGIFFRPLSLFTLSGGYYVPDDDGSDPVVRVRVGFDF